MRPGLRREPGPDLDAVGEDAALVARIHDEIARSGPITFARFMELALYDPASGYYRGAEARPGRAGDFLTAPETHPIFGATLARGLVEVWDRLGRPDPFVLREFGAGSGTLVISILDALRDAGSPLREALRYHPVEVEPARLDALAERLSDGGHGDVLLDGADRTPPEPIVGVVLANEVLDALPTHRLVAREGRLREVLVGARDGRFVDVEAEPTTPALAARLESEGVVLEDGQQGEICLVVDDWIAMAAAGLARGLFLLIDYGHPAPELYDPGRRRSGTLLAYVRHRAHDDPYRHVGRQDLTAHVDITAVRRAAEAAGLVHLATTTQAEFLVGLGIEELFRAIQADPATTMDDYLELRSSVGRLLDPAATGRFRVMGFGRSWPPDAPPLRGLAYRFVR